MARKKTTQQKKKQTSWVYLAIGIFFIFFGILSCFNLGFLGILLANVLRFLVGDTYRLLACLLAIYGGALLLSGDGQVAPQNKRRWIAGILFYLGLLIFCHALYFGASMSAKSDIFGLTWQKLYMDLRSNLITQQLGGGMLGAVLYSGTHFLVSQAGSYMLAVLSMLVGVFLWIGVSWEQILLTVQKLHNLIANWHVHWCEQRAVKKEQRQAVQAEAAAEIKRKADLIREQDQNQPEKINKNQVRPLTPGEELAKAEAERIQAKQPQEAEQLELEIDSYQLNSQPKKSRATAKGKKTANEMDEDNEVLDFQISAETEDQDYLLPESTLLNEIPITDQSEEYQQIEEKVTVLERTFQSFGVQAKVVRASLGPAVTKFEVQPAIGVKVSKVVGLTDDLALALAAKDVRIEAPIPGKSLIGIEVPNNTVSMVSFRDIIEAQPQNPDKLLEVPLGRDISGAVICADLAKMPHLLIAGSTGSGKSVCINSIITSILMRAKPHEVKMMMIDPKMVELNVYNGVPHLLTPVVTNPRKAAQALHKVVDEMERRYELFAASGVRNITGYNSMIAQNNLNKGDNHPILPFIVVVVDELADLMMVASNEVEDAITRLAQMARAAGIHMILATQRPSVDVITGIIKANVPSRIAFAVSSGTDSRTIIDTNGAEKLLGRGDMLFLPMGENKPVRVQGAFISDEEVETVVEFVSEQQEADYQENMMPTEEQESAVPQSQDELYEEALQLIIEMQTASSSLLQRRFRIGYNRAARLIDEMEQNGVIGPSEGSKPRKVFLTHLPTDEVASDDIIPGNEPLSSNDG